MESRAAFHYRIQTAPKLLGFAAASVRPNEYFWVLARGFVHSDQKEFHKYTDQMFSSFLGERFHREQVNLFLILLHRDGSAEVHVNDLEYLIKIKAKRDLLKGEPCKTRDIADIVELRFVDISIDQTAGIVFCFRHGWRFGLFFDFSPLDGVTELDLNKLSVDLGRYFKYLAFQELYTAIQNEKTFNKLFADGWFPFIPLIGGEYEQLSAIYDDPKKDSLLSTFLDSFDNEKLYGLTNKWWRISSFNEKKAILLAGIEAYLSNTTQGYITCIKTLYSEIEGILRLSYVKAFRRNPDFHQLKQYAKDRAESKFASTDPISLPELFYRYLDEVLFKGFDLGTHDIALSRHSASHGVAASSQYTRERALQAILTLDHASHFMD